MIELLVVVAVIAVLVGLLLPALASARRAGRAAACGSNLKQMGVASGAYSATNGGVLPSLTWRAGDRKSRFDDLNDAPSTKIATGRQVVDILRTKAGRPQMPDVAQEAIDAGSSWTATIFYTYTVMWNELGGTLPVETAACPEHKALLEAQRGLLSGVDLDFDGLYDPEHEGEVGGEGDGRRWKPHLPYQSSYEIVAASYDP
ncbi:MAG: DUF1559 domain-containing protein, partial [Planctomycetota bacterium]